MRDLPPEIFFPSLVLGCIAMMLGWLASNWMRMRHGYPIENSWGKALYPEVDNEAKARIQLLTQENAQLRAEIGSVKDRLANVERIVTDSGYEVASQIDALRTSPRRSSDDKIN